MDFVNGDLLYSYQGNYDANGTFILNHEIKAKCNGLDGAGRPIITVITGAINMKAGQKYIRAGNIINTVRQAGMFFDAITAYNPRLVIYDGLNSASQLGGTGIVDSSLIISQFGKLGNINNTNLGGYLTDTGLVNGTPYVGVYTKSLFADLSGNSKLLIKQDDNNLISFVAGTLMLKATTFSLTMGATSFIKIANAGAGANGFILDAAGLRGYDTVLGETFNLPTDGSAPTFSSGIIRSTIFELYTAAIIRTSATVGDGGVNSAGLLMNNTGIYGCKANQLLANANVKILADGTFSFTGDTNNQISWNGSTLAVKGSITLTNTISADSVVDGSTNKAYTGTEKTKLGTVAQNADVTLTAINGGLTVTGGGITLSAAGKFCGGKSTFADSNVGFFLGYESAAYKFKIYNSASKYFEYDGSNFTLVGGTITGGRISGAIIETNSSYPITRIIGNYIYWGAGIGAGYWQKISSDGEILTFSTSSSHSMTFDLQANLTIGGKMFSNSLDVNTYFIISNLGRLTKVNNISATDGYFLRGDGTSFTPTNVFTVNTVTPTSPNRTISIVVGGTTYYLHAKTTND